MKKKRILSGMRPTGKLHIGHMSVLENWVKLQDEYDCYFMAADWHALTTGYDNTEDIKQNIFDMVVDWLSVGLDPEKSAIFVQSAIKEHAELHLLLSMLTPLSWLERCPTYKDQIQQLKSQNKDINTYGFLGYPLLMAADIMVYLGNAVPVGEDQLPHLEFTRELTRRFNYLYNKEVFPEPQAILAKTALLPGVDGRKMSKSYKNEIAISATENEIMDQVKMMVTDPARIHKTDPGHPEICIVCKYQEIYNAGEVEEIKDLCRKGEIGCFACKKKLGTILNNILAPVREKREELAKQPALVYDIIAAGEEKARKEAAKTMELVRAAMKI